MKSSVLIKNEKYGLRIRLDETESWESLLEDIREKFRESANFFEDAALTLTFAGRRLSEEEEDTVIGIIEQETRIRIVCVFSEDPARCEPFLRARNFVYEQCMQSLQARMAEVTDETQPIRLQKETQPESGTPQRGDASSATASNNKYQILLRSLHEGDIYKTERTVIVIGNVEEGAALTTLRDAIVLGSVRGVVRAGEEGRGRHFVASSDLRPKKLSIDGVVWRGRTKRFSKALPAIAAVREQEICIVPFDQDMEALFRDTREQ